MTAKRRVGLGFAVALVILLVVLGAQSRQINTEIEIDAPTETVWGILTDLGQYEAWNPHITEAEGDVREGNKLTIRIKQGDGSSMTFHPTVTTVAPNAEFRWLGRVLMPRVFDGEHIFEIAPQSNDKTRLIHRETFRGILVLPFWGKLNTETRRGFEAMNAAIKERAEAMHAGTS